MFTWIQRYFQKHLGVIMLLILLIVGVPMVIVFTPGSTIGQPDRHITSREVFGYNLGSPEDQARLFGDANLSATLQLGYAGINSEQLQQYALQRAAALHMADELRIPATTKAEVTEHIKSLAIFATPEGSFDAQRYDGFRTSLKSGGRITEADVSRVIADDVRADKVRDILAGPGYVLDSDVIAQLKLAQTQWTLGIATIDYESFKPTVDPTNERLAQFFGDNTFRYEIPPRVRAAYVSYPLEAFLSQVTVTDDELRAVFDSDPGRFQKPAAEGQEAAAAGPADFAIVRDQVENTVRQAKARRLATKAASDLSLALFEGKISNDPTVLESFLSAHQVKLQPLQPFTEEAGPAELNNSAEIAAAAFKLNAERFYSDAIPAANGAVVLFWQETLPTRTPLLTEVLAEVKADYTAGEKRKQFVELGRKAKTQLATQLQGGADFATAVEKVAASLGVTITAKQLEPFDLTNPPQDSSFTSFNVLEGLEQGQVSDMAITRDQGVLVYALERKLPDLSPDNPQFGEMRAQIAAFTGRMGASRILSEMVEEELRRTEPKL
jgi:peptidyl-prolyl cis-trans isomerase D